MKKKVIIIGAFLLALIMLSCSADEQFLQNQNKANVQGKVGDLIIVGHELDWQFRPNGFGIRVPFYTNGTYPVSYQATTYGGSTFDITVTYSCPIANIKEQRADGSTDFVVDKVASGIANGNGGYDFPGLLAITTFQNGLPVGQVIKQTFDVSPTHVKNDFDWTLENYYDEPFMAIPARTADMYTNRAIVRSGKQVVVVEVNPDGLFEETDTTNNITKLPLNVVLNGTTNENLGYATVDESAYLENVTIPASEIVVTKNFQGRNKFVKIDWHCDYHEPIYVKHHFTIRKNGVIVADNFDLSEYTDFVKGNFTSATYSITITTALGESAPTIVTVTR